MTEAEITGLIRRVAGISQQADEQATQPDSVTAENYARVVAEVMRRVAGLPSPCGDVSGEGENNVPLEEAGAVAAVTG